jgi:hypothetical protein
MKCRYTFVHLSIALILLACASKSEKEIAVERFVTALLNDSINVNGVTPFFENARNDDKTIAGYVTAIRASLKEQPIKLDEIVVLPYDKAEEKLKYIDTSEKKNVFGVFKKGELVFPVLVNNENKIVTCTAVNKGGRGYFLIW